MLLRRPQSTTKQVVGDPYDKKEQQEKRRRQRRPTNLDTTTTKPAKGYYNTKGVKIDNTTKGAKASSQPTKAAKHLPEAITNTMTTAKHLPEQNGGKVSTNDRRETKHLPEDDQCNPDDVDKTSEGRHRSRNS